MQQHLILETRTRKNAIRSREIMAFIRKDDGKIRSFRRTRKKISRRGKDGRAWFRERSRENVANNKNNRPFVRIGNETIVDAKLPRGGWLKNPFDDLKYIGWTDTQNPIKFIRRFEKIAEYENVQREEQLYYFGKCLKGTASNWFDMREPENIEDAKKAFTDYYWGEEQQARFRELVYAGTYDKANKKIDVGIRDKFV